LSDAGIVPSESRTYTAAAINAALKAFRGVEAKIQCDKGELNEIWYFYHVRGSLQTGTFIPTKPGMHLNLMILNASSGLT
jgi:hypothetical protein